MSFLRRMAVPATESQLAVALCLSVVIMSAMLWVIVWQADLIEYQRDLIRWLHQLKFGG